VTREIVHGEEWLERYLHDYLTLEEAAVLAGGITREGVRLRLKARGLVPRGRAETLRLREMRDVEARGSAIKETFFKTRTVDETASTVELSVRAVERYLQREVPDWNVLTKLPRTSALRYSIDDLLNSLKDAATSPDEPLTTTAYALFVASNPTLDDGRKRPGVQAMMLRFGSWNAAVTEAGLLANPHGGPPKGFDEVDVVSAIVACWRDTGDPPTAAKYDLWQMGQEGRPSAATARKLFESWPSIQVRAWQVVHGVLLDQDDEAVVVPATISGDPGKDSEIILLGYRSADEGAEVSLPSGYTVAEYNALERAVQSHARVQNEVAAAGKELGMTAHSPRLGGPAFDVAFTDGDGTVFVVEVKSATAENLELQLRLGLGQVLKYAHQLSEHSSRVVPIMALEMRPDELWGGLLSSLGVGLIVAGSAQSDLAQIMMKILA